MKNIPEDFAPHNFKTGGPQANPFAPAIQLDFEALINRMLRNWYWFVLAIGICFFLAWLHLRYTTPVYQAQTSMLIEEQSSSGGLSTDVIAQELGFENTYKIDNEIFMLRSKYLMERVVNLLGLDISYFHLGSVRDVEIYKPDQFGLLLVDTVTTTAATANEPIVYGSVMVRFDNANTFSLIRSEGDTASVSYDEPLRIGNRRFLLAIEEGASIIGQPDIYQIIVRKPSDVAGGYNRSLYVAQVESSGVVSLSITDPVPEKATDILNALVAVYEQQIVEEQRQTGGQTVAFIEERLEYVTDELYEVESNVASFKQNANISVDLSTQGSNYLSQMNEADAQLAELQIRRELVEEVRRTLTEENSYDPLPLASEVISGVLSDLIVQYNQLIYERDQSLEFVTESHPTVATFSEQLNNLKESLLRSINSILRETNERATKIEERIAPLQAQMNRLPANEKRLLQIMRQQEIKQNLFIFLMEKREEAAITIAAQTPNTRIIDRASSSPNPVSPNKTMIYLFAFGVGLIVPGGTIFLREVLGTKLGTEKEIMKVFPYPVVGRITQSKDHGSIVVTQNSRNGVAEAFRLLRTNLGFMLPADQPSVIMVTSSVSGEGKSFIASNLSAALALSKKRVVVVGLDMRKPKLATMVSKSDDPTNQVGLSNYLIGQASYEDVIKPTVQEGLHLIASGPIPPNPTELLMDGRMGNLIHRLRQDFDVIILDAPPVGVVTDGLLMKDYINVTLFMVRVGVTPKKSVNYITEIIETGKLPRLNMVINGINPKASYGYGYGYYE
ncbi:capsular exopolysaccharide synthesis family protein [Neolewinella xylanilytica]|uniref:non-specific protein-tyrosine kinase n=1 Tax=Neolewinella xylanilytica TaxID=1514080 RepID=A0A2S6I7Q5_9BACT|nr:tyrosine-protein kinase [Neolewinella xylanilytica]PPK87533.1 capsular exopolysaccharide synthesis family protein [Neolewinella xylanilytica]